MFQKSKTITNKFVLVPLLCYLSCASFAQSVCRGRVAAPNETTRLGLSESISIVEREPRKSIFGVVNDANGQPLKDVLVEVFALPMKKANNEQKERVIACTTDKEGRFCFTKLAAGKYEVLYSMDSGWKHMRLLVVLAPNAHRSVNQKIEIWMQSAT